jgi:hypothetical protein
MATAISFFAVAICATLGALIALVVMSLAAMRLHSSPAVLLGSRIGGLAMLLPSFWIAIFLGGPLGGGLLIGMIGEPGARLGVALGTAGSFFFGLLIGAILGAALGSFVHIARHSRS